MKRTTRRVTRESLQPQPHVTSIHTFISTSSHSCSSWSIVLGVPSLSNIGSEFGSSPFDCIKSSTVYMYYSSIPPLEAHDRHQLPPCSMVELVISQAKQHVYRARWEEHV